MDRFDDRRRHVRFNLEPMYSRVVVRRIGASDLAIEGHAYDISSGGVRFELDEAIRPGERVLIRIDLPQTTTERSTERRSIYAFANIVWLADDEPFGPCSMAAIFTEFARESDEAMLRSRLCSGRYSLAA